MTVVSDDDLLSGLIIGSEEESKPQNIDTPDDIDIEALLASTPDPEPEVQRQIGGVAGDSMHNEFLPETEEITQVEVTPPPAPAPEELAQAEVSSLLATTPAAVPTPQPRQQQAPQPADMSALPNNNPSGSVADIIYRDYKVKRGDTLSGIALRHLGSRKRAKEIYQINKDQMSNPNILKIGHDYQNTF